MQKKKDWQIDNLNGELVKSTLIVIFLFNELLPYWFMVLEEGYTTDLEDYHKGY